MEAERSGVQGHPQLNVFEASLGYLSPRGDQREGERQRERRDRKGESLCLLFLLLCDSGSWVSALPLLRWGFARNAGSKVLSRTTALKTQRVWVCSWSGPYCPNTKLAPAGSASPQSPK